MIRHFGQVIRKDEINHGKVDDQRASDKSGVRFINQINHFTNMTVADVTRTVEDKETWRRLVP